MTNLKEALSNAYDEIETKGEENGQERNAEENKEIQGEINIDTKISNEEGREKRGENGKQEQGSESVNIKEANEEDEEVKLKYPRSWSKEYFKDFDSLPDNVKEYIKKRDQEVNQEVKRSQEAERILRSEYDPISETLRPHINDWKLVGLKPHQAIEQLLMFKDVVNEDPIRAIDEILKHHGANWNNLIDYIQTSRGETNQQTQPSYDPNLMQELNRIKQFIAGQEEKTYESSYNQNLEKVNEFAKNNPFFDDVADNMIDYIKKGIPLDKAYKLALEDSPSIKATYEDMLFQKMLKAKDERAKTAKAASFKAPNHRVSVTPEKGKSSNIRDILSEAYDAVAQS